MAVQRHLRHSLPVPLDWSCTSFDCQDCGLEYKGCGSLMIVSLAVLHCTTVYSCNRFWHQASSKLVEAWWTMDVQHHLSLACSSRSFGVILQKFCQDRRLEYKVHWSLMIISLAVLHCTTVYSCNRTWCWASSKLVQAWWTMDVQHHLSSACSSSSFGFIFHQNIKGRTSIFLLSLLRLNRCKIPRGELLCVWVG